MNLLITEFPSVKVFIQFWLLDTLITVAHQPQIIPSLPLADSKCIITPKSDLYTLKLSTKCSQFSEKLVTKSILSITRANKNSAVLYICAIAFKLSPSWGKSAIDIANQIAEHFAHLSNQDLAVDPKKYFTLKVIPPGWLHLQPTDLGIATWLQSLAGQGRWGAGGQGSRGAGEQGGRGAGGQGGRRQKAEEKVKIPLVPPSPSIPSTQSLFSVQYVHARCCSLLRLAKSDGKWGAIAPDAIPWLNEIGQLRLTHPAERNLISQLFSALDALYYPELSKNQNWEKLAQEITLSWEDFYRKCRIWGEVKTETPELAQARLGLLMATQTMLRLLLEDYLGISAPLEL
ncbi:DALR anticodon-binding domain-containing protein [[Phormidium ambiguum] IAM M-71]|uniref:DALR anticodon-binding domain-containing protein n=1 Tax=[Phormidium ambiguum] IAM M-71 TaxID=454136 RepID=UPI001C49DEEA|nr:DALR anticodon-binding domain-containing protein [Phormidium ambiguum]